MLLASSGPVLGFLVSGYAAAFWTVLVFGGLVWVMITRARSGQKVPAIRKLAGLDAIDEVVGRATEMGRAVVVVPGLGGVGDTQTISQYYVLGHVAKTCAKYDTKILSVNVDPVVYAVNYEIVRQAYLEAGRPDAFSEESVQFLTSWQFSFAQTVMAIYEREQPAATVMWGSYYAETLLFIEKAAQMGMVQIGATANTFNLPFFVACCDYYLIAEEMYAASAYLSKEPILVGTIVGEDWVKILIFAFIIVGTVLSQVQSKNWLAGMLKK